MTVSPMLQLDQIIVRYGAIMAVQGVSCEVREGEIIVLLGANGAGKSSLLRAILGLTPVDSGRVWFQGQDVTGWRTEALVREGLTLTPEGRNVFQSLTVKENLRLGGATMAREQAVETLERMLEQFLHKEYKLPFATMGLKEDLREIKNNSEFVSKREEILSMIWDMEEEIMGKEI